MSKRKTKAIAFNISAGTFGSFEEAVKEANSIKIWLARLCERHGYSCKALLGVSKNNPHVGSVKTKRTGGRGRPSTVFERKSSYIMRPAETEPHLHLVLYANPADMISSLLAKHLNNKYKRKVVWFNDCSAYVEEAVDYALRQSLKVRTLEYAAAAILDEDTIGFYAAVEQANTNAGCVRVAFTQVEIEKSPETPENTGVSEDSGEEKELQCNLLLNITTNIKELYIDKILPVYTYIKGKIKKGIDTICKLFISS